MAQVLSDGEYQMIHCFARLHVIVAGHNHALESDVVWRKDLFRGELHVVGCWQPQDLWTLKPVEYYDADEEQRLGICLSSCNSIRIGDIRAVHKPLWWEDGSSER